jgi:hypothetical protein
MALCLVVNCCSGCLVLCSNDNLLLPAVCCRNNEQATADVTFDDLCIDDTAAGQGQLSATVTGVAPAPAQTLTLNGQPIGSEDAPALLFQNVIQAWGNLSTPLGPDDVLEDTIGSKIVKYFFVPHNATAESNFTFKVNSADLELHEGYYALSAKVKCPVTAVTAVQTVCL